jgi:hypothetical protein
MREISRIRTMGSALSRRAVLRAGLMTLGACGLTNLTISYGETKELKLPNDVSEQKFDFEAKGIEGWTAVTGQWAVEDMADAPSRRKVLVQRATKNEFNVIVAPPGPYSDVDVSMKFNPISGREDASGASCSGSWTADTTLSGRTPSRTISASTPTIGGATRSQRRK